MATVREELWAYRQPAWASENLVGCGVEARDGSIGKINEVGATVRLRRSPDQGEDVERLVALYRTQLAGAAGTTLARATETLEKER